jgi:hypothetical protein
MKTKTFRVHAQDGSLLATFNFKAEAAAWSAMFPGSFVVVTAA